jgi:hypothetical protein
MVVDPTASFSLFPCYPVLLMQRHDFVHFKNLERHISSTISLFQLKFMPQFSNELLRNNQNYILSANVSCIVNKNLTIFGIIMYLHVTTLYRSLYTLTSEHLLESIKKYFGA